MQCCNFILKEGKDLCLLACKEAKSAMGFEPLDFSFVTFLMTGFMIHYSDQTNFQAVNSRREKCVMLIALHDKSSVPQLRGM